MPADDPLLKPIGAVPVTSTEMIEFAVAMAAAQADPAR